MLTRLKTTLVALVLMASPAMAEMELSFYMGHQSLPHSRATGTVPGTGAAYNRLIKWEGKPFSMPPYYGTRAMWWQDSGWGFGLEFTHTKAYASATDMAALGFSRLEFSDGHNIITLNAMKRWENKWGNWTPYAGGGLGIALPHVDAQAGASPRTYGYQFAGPALRLTAGAKYDLSDRWALFSEYQFTISDNAVTFDDPVTPGSMNVVLKTNAVNFGISMKF